VSQEAAINSSPDDPSSASTPTGGNGSPTTPEPPPARSAAGSQSPLSTARVDQAQGVIWIRGHLDRVGVDLLWGSVLALHREGHRWIEVRLRPGATMDTDAGTSFSDLARRLSADGVQLATP